MSFVRSKKNPILHPDESHEWEAKAAFNGSVCKDGTTYHLVYRAISHARDIQGQHMEVSTIGYSQSSKRDEFTDRRQLITPSEDWDKFGCEDPRITKIGDEYFVFYTALSDYPFRPSGIKIGVAVFTDLQKSGEKHLVTPFNAKAMTLLPEKINGKYVALLTVNTDLPPSRIAVAWFDKKEDIWSQSYWHDWYQHLEDHVLPLWRINSDQLEVGATPLLTEKGWLFLYAHIQHYFDPKERTFGIEAALLEKTNPQHIIGRSEDSIMKPKEEYELSGMVSNVVFPSGALMEDGTLHLYYGAADTTTCLASNNVNELLEKLRDKSPVVLKADRPLDHPLLTPEPTHDWEAKAVFNPAVFYHDNKIHLLYRAMGYENTSVLGYAASSDGVNITSRNEMPMYVPRAEFETKKEPRGNSGCEDPRITKIGDTLYMCYTAYNGINPPRVAITSIAVDKFLGESSNWKDPVLISPPGIDDKDAAIFPEKVNGKFVIVHRIQNEIVMDHVDSLDFDGNTWLRSLSFITPRAHSWDSERIGISAPPMKTEHGWLALYHGVSKDGHKYRVGAMLLQLDDPSVVLARTPWPILEPEAPFEKEGNVPNVVFPCGAALTDDTLFIYYGGADKVVGVAKISFSKLLTYLLDYPLVKK